MSKKDDKAKSWILLVAGLVGIAYQQYTGDRDWMLLLVFTVMAGIPIPIHLYSLIKNSSTISQLSASQLESSESDSENSSQNSPGDENG